MQSFDPFLLKELRLVDQSVPVGWLCCNWWQQNIKLYEKLYLNFLGPYKSNQIDFLSVEKNLLQTKSIRFLRDYLKVPMIAWTIESMEELQVSSGYCDNIIFEGFLP